jgi:hypothetical protein
MSTELLKTYIYNEPVNVEETGFLSKNFFVPPVVRCLFSAWDS